VSELDAELIAKRLGLTDEVICQLQAHGYLQRLAVTAHELDARIYRAHLAHLNAASFATVDEPGWRSLSASLHAAHTRAVESTV
jgi:hypothetical protein